MWFSNLLSNTSSHALSIRSRFRAIRSTSSITTMLGCSSRASVI